MAYDPNLPANNSPISSAELRSQFAGLKALIDDLQAQINQKASLTDLNNAITAGSAKNVDGFNEPDGDISDPPQTVEVAAIQGKLDDLISSLKH